MHLPILHPVQTALEVPDLLSEEVLVRPGRARGSGCSGMAAGVPAVIVPSLLVLVVLAGPVGLVSGLVGGAGLPKILVGGVGACIFVVAAVATVPRAGCVLGPCGAAAPVARSHRICSLWNPEVGWVVLG